MPIKGLAISVSKKKLFLLAVILGLGVMFAIAASFVFAFHPGETQTGVVPQGPDQIACGNEGRQGIDEAITSDGQVHCDCTEIPPKISIDDGVCTDLSRIGELGLPQCCTLEAPNGTDCGADQDWVVGVAAFNVCFILDS